MTTETAATAASALGASGAERGGDGRRSPAEGDGEQDESGGSQERLEGSEVGEGTAPPEQPDHDLVADRASDGEKGTDSAGYRPAVSPVR